MQIQDSVVLITGAAVRVGRAVAVLAGLCCAYSGGAEDQRFRQVITSVGDMDRDQFLPGLGAGQLAGAREGCNRQPLTPVA